MALWPLPTAKRVPEAQAPPNCIPIPNRNAPIATLSPNGATDAVAWTPPKPAPVARIGVNRMLAAPSSSAWARSARPWPTATNCRQAEVKPNREWNRPTPSARPRAKRASSRGPWPSQTHRARPTASAPPTTSTTGCGGSAGAGGGAVGTDVRRSHCLRCAGIGAVAAGVVMAAGNSVRQNGPGSRGGGRMRPCLGRTDVTQMRGGAAGPWGGVRADGIDQRRAGGVTRATNAYLSGHTGCTGPTVRRRRRPVRRRTDTSQGQARGNHRSSA